MAGIEKFEDTRKTQACAVMNLKRPEMQKTLDFGLWT
jgi:hypothetical protein